MDRTDLIAIADKNYDRLLGWIGRYDAKVSFVVATDLAMLAVLAHMMPAIGDLDIYGGFGTIAAVLSLVGSLVCVISSASPKTEGPSRSLIYLGSIANRSKEHFVEEFMGYNEERNLNDLLDQMYRISEILSRKFSRLKSSYKLTAIGSVFWVLSLYIANH